VPVHVYNTSTEVACLKVIFTKFACIVTKATVRCTGTHRHTYCHESASGGTVEDSSHICVGCGVTDRVISSAVILVNNESSGLPKTRRQDGLTLTLPPRQGGKSLTWLSACLLTPTFPLTLPRR